jgi:polyisoprenoid-binding protein YceI
MQPKFIICTLLLAFLLALALGHTAEAATSTVGAWTIDADRSLVEFTVTKLGYDDVDGRFTRFSGDVRYDPARPEASSIRWSVRVSSVKTDEPRRDQSLQGKEYFDARRHPELRFESNSVRRLDGGRLEVAGRITIKGRTQPLTIVVQPAAAGAGFETEFALNRYDFDVNGGKVMGALIGRKVNVHLVALPKGEAR